MLSRQVIQLTAGRGVEGDRYQSGLGTYSCFSEPGRQLTLISADAVEAALPEMKGRTCDLRRNVVLRGCSAETLNSAVGRTVTIGDAEIFVHRLCVPCVYNQAKNNCPRCAAARGAGRHGGHNHDVACYMLYVAMLRAACRLMNEGWHACGVSCEVVTSGLVRVSDRVNLRLEEAPNASRVNDGGKPDGFFVAPKHRSAEQARNARASAERGRVVQNSDPVGYERLQAAYRSVGIRSFFLADTTGPSVGQSGFALLSTLPLVLAAVVLALALAQLPWR